MYDFIVHFAVSVPFELTGSQYVFVTGSHEKLGNWEVDHALKLTKSDNGMWVGTATLGVETVKFRYFIGYYLQGDVSKQPTLTISRWETHLTPRSVLPPVEASKTGICRANLNDVFGFSGARENLTSSWVLRDDQNQIMLMVTGQVLKFFKRGKADRDYSLKIVPFDLRNKYDLPNADDDDELLNDEDVIDSLPNFPSYSHTDIAVLTSDDDFKFRDQHQHGQPYHNNDYLMFRTLSVAVEHLSFRVELYHTNNDLAAVGYALPSALHDTYGKTSVPLLNKKGLPTGKIYLEYLFIRPLKLPTRPPIMNNCYARHWKKRTTLEVGHRGMGNSYTKCAVARENTLHSLNSAAKYGADLVEFDVHLTKDKVPIIFHDFHVLVTVAKRVNASADSDTDDGLKKEPSVDFYQLAVKDLNLNQLQLLHLDHIHSHSLETSSSNAKDLENKQNPSLQRITGGNDEAEEHKPFPTLIEVLTNVNENVGFNIEIKYPQMLINGQNECDGYFERNEFVDIILAQILNNAGHRRVVFSSFDPDICLMLSIKQKKYPVLFLCIGDTTRHISYMDERTRTSMTAVKFASVTELIGVNFHSEDVLKDPSPIKKAKDLGIITFVWGDELSDKKNVEYFKKTLLVEGVIYDRIGENESRSNVFMLERAMKTALFAKKPDSPTSLRCNSHGQLNNQRVWSRGGSVTTWSSSQVNGTIDDYAATNNNKYLKQSEEYPIMRRSRPNTPVGLYQKAKNFSTGEV